MRCRLFLAFFIFIHVFANAQDNRGSVQGFGDGEAAQKYAEWVKKAIDEERWKEALAAAQRAADFSNVSSDVSYQFAVVLSHEGGSRIDVISALDRALEINRWVIYSENKALLFKAHQLIAIRKFVNALAVLDKAGESADASELRLLALKGMAFSLNRAEGFDPVIALSRFRGQVLAAMDRYSRDPRPLRIFFEYARNKKPESSELTQSDQNLLELAFKRLPFLLEADPDLAWLAASLISDTEQAKRYVSAYRAGGIPSVQNKDFKPVQASIPVALNLGLLDDTVAVEELFSSDLLDVGVMNELFNFLRSEEGRDLFTEKLLSFSGTITSDDDHDGYIDSKTLYKAGIIKEFAFDITQDNYSDLRVVFSADGIPVTAWLSVTENRTAEIQWERYPSVKQVTYELKTVLTSYAAQASQAAQASPAAQKPVFIERFLFRPADYQYAPVNLVFLGGSKKFAGPAYPVLMPQYTELTRRALVSLCASIQRPSIEFEGAAEELFLEGGRLLRAEETSGGKLISVTEFERGSPVIQRLDMDMDGRMETIRRFFRADSSWIELDETFNYRRLIASSESDWTGKGVFKTGEVYQKDGSIVYSWDTDGSGDMNYSETDKK